MTDGAFSPRPCRTIRRVLALALALAALVAVLLVPAASALAEPAITIDSPAAGSWTNDRTPEISGTSSDSVDEITVTILQQGSPLPSFKAQPEPLTGHWSVQTPIELEDGAHEVIAEQTELIFGTTGNSGFVPFSVHASKPQVSLDTVSSPTSDSTPSFSGSASEQKPVTVDVYAGTHAGGTPYAEAQASGTGGSWTSGVVNRSLPDGTYTARAEQESEWENGTGFSQERTFVVHAATPQVTLNPVSSPTGDSTPSFSGTASEASQVIVHVYAAGHVGGTVYAVALANGTGGGWSSERATPALADGTYTAVAEQESEFGDGPGASEQRTFTVEAEPPAVTLEEIASPTGERNPSFRGTASDTTGVTVYVFKGGSAQGSPVTSAHASGTGGAWSSGPTSSALSEGSYTAVAMQANSLGNEGHSGEIHFQVITAVPNVTLNPVTTPSKETAPSFSGFASDHTEVEVLIYRGSSAGGSPVAAASAGGNGGEWSSGGASPPLDEGEYTAIARQYSSLGNGPGYSEPIHFRIVTAPPHVTLNASSVDPESGNTTPSFTGTAGDTTPVSVLIYPGGSASGTPAASASAAGTGGSWTSGHASPALGNGTYTAVAVQNSSLGNPPGRSNEVTFVVNTNPPSVSLNPVAAYSNNTKPSFSGTASDHTAVVVHVYDSGKQEVASATSGSPSGGKWVSGSLSRALTSGSYTAVAVQESSLEDDRAGESAPISFTVETAPPEVRLNAPAKRSGDTAPTFSGTATDTTPVTVNIYRGAVAGGTPVATANAGAPVGGSWTSAAASPVLTSGTYTAQAVENSSIGNGPGTSEARTFEVDTSAPKVELNQPARRSNDTTPSFSGTASETTTVTVEIFKGGSTTGSPVSKATANGTGGAWSSGPASPALAPGAYTARAVQDSSIGNGAGYSSALEFEVDTSAPTVTLTKPASPSRQTSPTFTGTAGEASTVTVHVLEGTTEVAHYEGAAAAGSWSIGPVTPALSGSPRREYKVYATEASAIGNPPGRSEEWPMVIDSTSPGLGINALPAISNNRSPSFTGTVTSSDPKPEAVIVHVMEAEHQVATAEARPSGGRWTTGAVSPTLEPGEHHYAAYATEADSLGNPEGRSGEISFTVDTNPPGVTLEQIAASSNDLSPSFSGTTTEAGEVTVSVYAGKATSGSTLRTVHATATEAEAGKWTWASKAITALEARAGTYTAIARQSSGIGNGEGVSKSDTFSIDPGLPTLALGAPPAQIDSPTPGFSGSSNGSGAVEVSVYPHTQGAACEQSGTALATAIAAHGNGAWNTGPASPALPDGSYAAIAYQSGASTKAACFTIDTNAPAVSLTSPRPGAELSGGSLTAEGAAGTAPHDRPQVSVKILAGSSTVQEVAVTSSGGRWSAPFAGLAPGSYTIRAQQSDEAGNVGTSAAVPFTVGGATSPPGPAAAFTFSPSHPHTDEPVTLVSSSTDPASPLTGYAWNTAGAFATGGESLTTKFSTPGSHTVQLRVNDAAGRTSVSSQTIHVTYPLMSPFPSVRILTTRSHGSVRLTLLSVQAPAGTFVRVSCSGHGCPAKTQTRTARKPGGHAKPAVAGLTFPGFERRLPAGVTLQIRIYAPGLVGKFTSFQVRRGKLPKRADACVEAMSAAPVECPR